MSEEQDTISEGEPAAKQLVTVDRLTRDRQRRDAKAKERYLALPNKKGAERFAFQLFLGFRVFGLATIVCLLAGIMGLFIENTDISFLADFGFKPFVVCLIAYVWLKVAWTTIGLVIDLNEAEKPTSG